MVPSVEPVDGGCAAPDGIRAIACCDQGVHPISGHCTRSDWVQCSLTGASPEKSHAILPRAFQMLKSKRWNHAVSEVRAICVRREMHANKRGVTAMRWRYGREMLSRGGSLIQS